ncbi:telomere-binding alpha subunit central domain protein [Trichophyton benhamiae CBS 112371]|uniref:Protection of telomeres protein 1 n=1 Tax=Arthroderma benhamiae (strain ATCC MYA-4681 / CBS 112371) TaxID=663331 RepID=D4B413_ARTBC|nr:telomere-binding alpha subunit central domain protein [Trichophyton benhamiae CBS 112371]EFE29861.1 telomere-binding alpha subunit central domain protein [Trichophyton benhamiae CBS 112371]
MERLPHGFEDVATAQSRTSGAVSIIAVVVDALSPVRTSGSSYMSTFTVKDRDVGSGPWGGLKVKYFHDNKDHLPDPDVGDVILLRNIKSSIVRGERMHVSPNHDSAAWVLWKRDNSNKMKPGCLKPTRQESEYASLLLKNNVSAQNISQSQHGGDGKQHTLNPTPSQKQKGALPSRKFCLLKDAEFSKFIDITGEVVKTFREADDRFILYVTDYTSNDHLFNYIQPSNGMDDDDGPYQYIKKDNDKQWRGPYGRMTILITLFTPHAEYAREYVKEKDYVTLYNVRIKADRTSGRMEGALHTDQKYPHKIQVHIINDTETDLHFMQLVKRKMQYWKKIRVELPKDFSENNQSRKAPGSDPVRDRKRKRQQEKRERLKEEKRKKKKDPDQPDFPRLVQTKRDELNPHNADTHAFKGSDGVEFQLPFQNVRYRSSVRVVDYFPHNLEDFSVLYNRDLALLSDDTDDVSDDSDSDANRWWEWRFCLLVEDGGPNIPPLPPGQTRERMPLFVWGSDAEFLLQMDAVNLRDNSDALASLREKLFVLWGDLEERKSADIDAFYSGKADTVSTKPFTCCIKEYGVKTGNKETDPISLGWERRFQMFQTAIS